MQTYRKIFKFALVCVPLREDVGYPNNNFEERSFITEHKNISKIYFTNLEERGNCPPKTFSKTP